MSYAESGTDMFAPTEEALAKVPKKDGTICINQKAPGLCGYVGFDHKSRRYELFAKNSLAAVELLRKHVKPSKKDMYRCHVTLAIREDGSEVTQTTC